ncbi:hypothetical protein Fcan01_16609 [Folsomia candida]|uniref:Uncharacterized protein n=1 Tax=Folsomia candida TaxID=158441 RepID=A0A226DUH0_FOLCA|nr:hypothetical protein Fcan01_16609 [Folsomia candida]
MLTYLPCTPPFLISMIPGFCGDKRQDITGRVLIQILVHVLESVVQLQLYLSAASMISYSLFVGCTCVLCYLSDFMSAIQTIKKDDVEECIQFYRIIQLIERLMNTFLSKRTVPGVLFCSIGVQVVACLDLRCTSKSKVDSSLAVIEDSIKPPK